MAPWHCSIIVSVELEVSFISERAHFWTWKFSQAKCAGGHPLQEFLPAPAALLYYHSRATLASEVGTNLQSARAAIFLSPKPRSNTENASCICGSWAANILWLCGQSSGPVSHWLPDSEGSMDCLLSLETQVCI